MRSTTGSLALVLLLAAGSVGAQELTIKLAGAPAAVSVELPDALQVDPFLFDPKKPITLKLSCVTTLDCTKAAVTVAAAGQAAKDLSPFGTASATLKQVVIPALAIPLSTMDVRYDGKSVRTLRIQSSTADASSGGSSTPESLALLLQSVCRTEMTFAPGETAFLVGPRAQVLRSQGRVTPFSKVHVYVRADKRLAGYITAARTSAFRTVGEISIVGAGLTIPVTDFNRQAAGAVVDPCTIIGPFELSDFAPGRGEIAVRIAATEGEISRPFDFAVNPVYTGSFALGAFRTRATDAVYGLRAPSVAGGDSILTADPTQYRVLYALVYSMFLPPPGRDIEAPQRGLLDYVHPAAGIVLNDITNNVLYGATIDMGSAAYLFVGGHSARVSVLDPTAGLQPDQPYPRARSTIPTIRAWTTSFAVGGFVDLRAAVQLLKTAATGTAAAATH